MKSITMTEFRKEPGERIRDVQKCGKSFLITKAGKPAARLVPVSDVTIINPDGSFTGPEPLTFRSRI
jgi:prevent-host-death family protein